MREPKKNHVNEQQLRQWMQAQLKQNTRMSLPDAWLENPHTRKLLQKIMTQCFHISENLQSEADLQDEDCESLDESEDENSPSEEIYGLEVHSQADYDPLLFSTVRVLPEQLPTPPHNITVHHRGYSLYIHAEQYASEWTLFIRNENFPGRIALYPEHVEQPQWVEESACTIMQTQLAIYLKQEQLLLQWDLTKQEFSLKICGEVIPNQGTEKHNWIFQTPQSPLWLTYFLKQKTRLLAYALKRIADWDEAEELLQQLCFEYTRKAPPAPNPDRDPQPYYYSIFKNRLESRIIDARRKKKPCCLKEPLEKYHFIDTNAVGDIWLFFQDTIAIARGEIQDEEAIDLFIDYQLNGLSYKVLSQQTSKSEETIRKKIRTIKKWWEEKLG